MSQRHGHAPRLLKGEVPGTGRNSLRFLKCSLAPAPRPRAAITGWRLLKGEGRGTGPNSFRFFEMLACPLLPQHHGHAPQSPAPRRSAMCVASMLVAVGASANEACNYVESVRPGPIPNCTQRAQPIQFTARHPPQSSTIYHLPSTSIHPSTQLPSTHPFITHPGIPSPIHTHPTSTHHAGWNPPPTIYTYPPAYYPSIRIHSIDLPIRPSTLPV